MTKYNNRTVTVDQIRFDSLDESRFYELLKQRKANGEIVSFELHPKYLLQPPCKYNGKNVLPILYVGDFLVYHLDGSEECIDTKGLATETALLKRKMMYYTYPDLKLTWLSRSLKYGDADGWIEYDDLKKRRKNGKVD